MGYDGFISYSHAADGELGPALERGLHAIQIVSESEVVSV